MKKFVKEIEPGDTFLDTLGERLTCISIEPVKSLGIPRSIPRMKIRFTTERGNDMHMNFSANRVVQVVK